VKITRGDVGESEAGTLTGPHRKEKSTMQTRKNNTQVIGEQVRTLSASSLIGDSVRNTQGENLGKIEDLMLDLQRGHIAYAVLSFGGFLGVGDKLFAVPWKALTLDTNNKEFILDINKKQLENAPGFDKNNWPEMTSEWGESIHRHYGVRPYWE
jgi:sporulation protein YlmC with PRC-barrel domain